MQQEMLKGRFLHFEHISNAHIQNMHTKHAYFLRNERLFSTNKYIFKLGNFPETE